MPGTRTEPGWTGVLLAGGRSRRLGRDKAGLLWQGRTLLEHQRAQLQAAGAARVVVSGDYPDAGAVPDTVSDLGPVGGLMAVAATLEDGPLLVLPIDMPRVSPALLAALAQAPAGCAHYAGHVLPLRLTLDAALRRWLDARMDRPSEVRSLRALHADFGGITLPLPAGAEALLANCNTPEQWEAMAS